MCLFRVSTCSPQKPSKGKFPQDSRSFECWWEARAVWGCCCDRLLCRASAILSLCSCSSTPGKEGTLVTEGALGFSSADPSQRRQFRPLTYRSAAAPDPALQLPGVCYLPVTSKQVMACLAWKCSQPVSSRKLGHLGVLLLLFESGVGVPHPRCCCLRP